MWAPLLSAVTLVKLAVILLGVFNLALMFKGRPSCTPSPTEPRQSTSDDLFTWSAQSPSHVRVFHRVHPPARAVRVRNHPSFQLLHLDVHARPRTLFTEETVHYPVNGTLADLEWASLVPAGNHGLVLLGPDEDVRPYAVGMFHTLHCLDRIRKAIVSSPLPDDDQTGRMAQAQYHVHHCFNYLRQMVLCAANTRLNPIDHVLPSGARASDGIGLTYQCRDWDAVYKAFEVNYALNRTVSRFAM